MMFKTIPPTLRSAQPLLTAALVLASACVVWPSSARLLEQPEVPAATAHVSQEQAPQDISPAAVASDLDQRDLPDIMSSFTCLNNADEGQGGPIAQDTSSIVAYGPGIGGDSLGNTTVGGPVGPKKCFIRFRAQQSSSLVKVTIPFLSADYPGYGGGSGGEWKLGLFADDGSSGHFPTGAPITSLTVHASTESDVERVFVFPKAFKVAKGLLYHFVIENVDPNPLVNYFSINNWVRLSFTEGGQLNPRFSTIDWGGGYFFAGSWITKASSCPIADITYGNGAHQGVSYGEASYTCPPGQGSCTNDQLVGRVDGHTHMIRERFTVSGGTRVIRGIGIRLLRSPGTTSDLVVTLRNSADVELDVATIPASSVPVGPAPSFSLPASWDDLGQNARWVTASFSGPNTLNDGDTLYLRFASTQGTYWAWVMRRLTPEYSYAPATAFCDGWSEYTTDGTTWRSLGRVDYQNDLQFYLIAANGNDNEDSGEPVSQPEEPAQAW